MKLSRIGGGRDGFQGGELAGVFLFMPASCRGLVVKGSRIT